MGYLRELTFQASLGQEFLGLLLACSPPQFGGYQPDFRGAAGGISPLVCTKSQSLDAPACLCLDKAAPIIPADRDAVSGRGRDQGSKDRCGGR